MLDVLSSLGRKGLDWKLRNKDVWVVLEGDVEDSNARGIGEVQS